MKSLNILDSSLSRYSNCKRGCEFFSIFDVYKIIFANDFGLLCETKHRMHLMGG
jgi:hypothetical protein